MNVSEGGSATSRSSGGEQVKHLKLGSKFLPRYFKAEQVTEPEIGPGGTVDSAWMSTSIPY